MNDWKYIAGECDAGVYELWNACDNIWAYSDIGEIHVIIYGPIQT